MANDADGLLPRDAEIAAAVLRWLDHLTVDLVRPTGVVPEANDREADVRYVGDVLRLPVVHGLQLRQPAPVLLHEVRELQQQIRRVSHQSLQDSTVLLGDVALGAEAPRHGHDLLHKGVVDVLVDDDAARGDAALARV